MTEDNSSNREVTNGPALLLGHVTAIAAGLIIMIVGLAMGVSLVLLPIGIPVGLVGLALFIWGLFGAPRNTPTSQPKVDGQ
jgi:hypothetical protein